MKLEFAANQSAGPSRWVVCWGEKFERESYFSDRSLAEAYAAAHRGVLIPMCATVPWPNQCTASHG